jgi:hypothetical protein
MAAVLDHSLVFIEADGDRLALWRRFLFFLEDWILPLRGVLNR